MNTRKVVVREGRVVIDGLEDYPDGTVLEAELIEDHDYDELDDEERAKLHEALDHSWEQAKAGKLQPLNDIIKEL